MTAYQTTSQANDLAATLPASLLAAFRAAEGGDADAARVLAASDIDAAMRYQGRKYDQAQEHEFPRLAYGDPPSLVNPLVPVTPMYPMGSSPTVIWDWDPTANSGRGGAIVPVNVRLAELFQTDYILAGGEREERLQAMRDGLSAQAVGSLSEQYFQNVHASPLVRRAEQLLVMYRLKQGQLL